MPVLGRVVVAGGPPVPRAAAAGAAATQLIDPIVFGPYCT